MEETDSGDLDYFRGEKCLSRGIFGNGGPYITPYSFVKDVNDQPRDDHKLDDNIESYKCGINVGIELCNY